MTSPLKAKTEAFFPMHCHLDWSPASPSSVPPRLVISPEYFAPAYPQVPLAKTVRDSRKLEETTLPFDFSKIQPIAPNSVVHQKEVASPETPPSPTSDSDSISPSSDAVTERVPRPPNAFMLFRSHFLKEERIPKTVEKRQQALSRVAGEIWSLMSADEKEVWHVEAAKKQREHKEKYPDYKFIPSPRGTRRNKDKVQTVNETATTAQERTQQLREKYTNFHGPSPTSSRKRRAKKDRGIGGSSRTSDFQPLHHSLPNTPMASPPSSPSKGMGAHKAPESLFYTGGQHRFPQRPSTSLGFTEYPAAPHPSGSGAGAEVKGFPGGGFMDFMGGRDQELFANPQAFDASSNWGMDNTMVVSSPHNPLNHQIAGPFPPPPAHATSSAFEMLNPMDVIDDGSKNNILFETGATEGPDDQICDSTFLETMTFNQQFLPFADNAFSQPLDIQNPENFFDTSKWTEFTNPFLSQTNDPVYTFE